MIDLALLRRVNSEINLLPYTPDPPFFDDWRPADERGGDCDSYATRKLKELERAGVPLEAMHLTLCKVEPLADPSANRCHLVLFVNTPDGDYMLDNRQALPVPASRIPELRYELIAWQDPGGTLHWKPLEGVTT